ncbi:MAG: GDP-mannose 4,6-dehydratase [Candidatus Sungbacteria bacterium]|uniref:GDP-mannose 4,6-dehydratase n=1 Tax=Candidatus Sungiibacteriota bacterium TaxID=2750080 RepID=A0A931WMX0_9BACT|nr:GDP-mannose 4,6-dehydratase [Candidatus Sungbacteria bacterium]
MKKVLITGGAGFIGYHLAKRLAAEGYELVIVDNFFHSAHDDDLQALLAVPNVRLLEDDLTQSRVWEKVGSGFDEVYHLVGINGTKFFYEIPHEVLRIGVSTTLNVLEWFRSENNKPGAKILYTSSNEAYASALEAFGKLPIPTPENVPLVIADTYNPRWSYGGQKLIGELFFIHYAKAYNFRMSIVRPHNFYGPRAGYEHVIPEIVGRVAAKIDPFPIFGADDTRSFCYITDAVEAIQTVMESAHTDGGTYHIGTTHETLIADLAEKIFSLMGWRPQKTDIKNSPEGSVKRRLADVSKIKKDTGWEAKTLLDDGLEKTIEWYLAHPKVPD